MAKINRTSLAIGLALIIIGILVVYNAYNTIMAIAGTILIFCGLPFIYKAEVKTNEN